MTNLGSAEPTVSAWYALVGLGLGLALDLLLALWLFAGDPSRSALGFADLLASAVAATGLLLLGLGVGLITGHAVTVSLRRREALAADDLAGGLATAFKDLPASRAIAFIGVVLVLAATYLARPPAATAPATPAPSPSAGP
jgi:hypothetical protein